MATKEDIAKAIVSLSYPDLIDFANDLVAMQKGAKEDGWEWRLDELHGEYGLAQMLYSWADAQGD